MVRSAETAETTAINSTTTTTITNEGTEVE